MDTLCNKSPYELLILKEMAQQEQENLFNLISGAVEKGYLEAKVEIAKVQSIHSSILFKVSLSGISKPPLWNFTEYYFIIIIVAR